MARWLNSLPVTNLDETAKALLSALAEANTLRVRPAARRHFLETVRRSVHGVITSIEQQSWSRTYPQPEHDRNQDLLVRDLLRELAIGYSTLVQEHSANKRYRRRGQLALAMQRVIHTLGLLLINCSRRYQAPPENLWRQLHALYQTAEQAGLDHLKVSDPLLKYSRRSSVGSAYKQILLLAAVGPYRMRLDEIDDAYNLFEHWAPCVQLLPTNHEDGVKANFHVDLESDAPPFCQRRDTDERTVIRRLDTTSLAKLVDAKRQRSRWHPLRRHRIQTFDPGLVQRMIIALGMPPMRQSIRLPTSASVQVLVGLTLIHRGLMASQGLNMLDAGLEGPAFSGRDLNTNMRQFDDDIWDLIYPGDLLQQARPEESATPKDVDSRTSLEQDWQLVNASHGGYCLLSDPNRATKAQIDELIALREHGDKQHNWQIGVIRWMQQLPEGLQVGVQILGLHPRPALSQIKAEDGRLSSPSRALLLPPTDNRDNKPATFLSNSMHHEINQCVLLDQPDGKSEILLTQLVESCSGFVQFAYQNRTRPAYGETLQKPDARPAALKSREPLKSPHDS